MTEKSRPRTAIIFEGDPQKIETIKEDLKRSRIELVTRPVTVIEEVEQTIDLMKLGFSPDLSQARYSLAIIGRNLSSPGILNSLSDAELVTDLVRRTNPGARILALGGSRLLTEQETYIFPRVSYFEQLPEARVAIIKKALSYNK